MPETFLPNWTLYRWTLKLAECCIRVTVLLEYLDLALDTRSWVSLHNSLAFTQILLYNCKEFLWWLFQLQTDFQLTTLNGCGITGWIFKFDRVFLTPVGFCVISPWSFSGFLLNHKKALLQWLFHLHAKFRSIPSSGLPCRRDRPSIFFLRKKSMITP